MVAILAIRIVRDYLLAIGIPAYDRQCTRAALPRRLSFQSYSYYHALLDQMQSPSYGSP